LRRKLVAGEYEPERSEGAMRHAGAAQ